MMSKKIYVLIVALLLLGTCVPIYCKGGRIPIQPIGTLYLSNQKRELIENTLFIDALSRDTDYDTSTINFTVTHVTYTETKNHWGWKDGIQTQWWNGEAIFLIRGYQRIHGHWELFMETKDVVTIVARFNNNQWCIEIHGANYCNQFAELNPHKYN